MTVEDLRGELEAISRRIQGAAMVGDSEKFVHLLMRERALPALIRAERARPVREAIDRLENERERLLEAEQRAREEPPPEVPAHLRGTQSPAGLKAARIGELVRAGGQVGAELRARRQELERIAREGEGSA